MDLIKVAISNEVKQTQHAATLFRANSTSSKVLTAYSKLSGSQYLKSTLQSLITEKCANPTPCEIDPAKIKKVEDIPQNMINLGNTTQLFLDTIYSSVSKAPA